MTGNTTVTREAKCCATCVYWAGPRSFTSAANYFLRYDVSSRAKCLKHSREMLAQSGCQDWTIWGAFAKKKEDENSSNEEKGQTRSRVNKTTEYEYSTYAKKDLDQEIEQFEIERKRLEISKRKLETERQRVQMDKESAKIKQRENMERSRLDKVDRYSKKLRDLKNIKGNLLPRVLYTWLFIYNRYKSAKWVVVVVVILILTQINYYLKHNF